MMKLHFAASWDPAELSSARVANKRSRLPKSQQAKPGGRLDFGQLVEALNPAANERSDHIWKKFVDHDLKLVAFYQLDFSGKHPAITKCLQIRTEEFRSGDRRHPRLVPSVFLDERCLANSDTPEAPQLSLSSAVDSVEDVSKLLQFIDLYPDVPEIPEDTASEDGSFEEGSSLLVDVDQSAPELREETPMPQKPSKKPKNDGGAGLSDSQVAAVDKVKRFLATPGRGKEEIYPGADVYFKSTFMQLFRKKLSTSKWEPRRDAADFAVMMIDAQESVFKHIKPLKDAIRQVFGMDFLNKVLNFIDRYHGMIVSGTRPPLSESRLVDALQGKVRHLHKSKACKGYSYILKYRPENKKVIEDPGIRKDVYTHEESRSLVIVPEHFDWNPAVPYDDPAFIPSYLVRREGYEPVLAPIGTFPPIYMKSDHLSYFKSAQSHEDMPVDSRWTRNFLYRIFDQPAISHLCYLIDKELEAGRKFVRSRRVLSPGFMQTFEGTEGYSLKVNGALMFRDGKYRSEKPSLKHVLPEDAKVSWGWAQHTQTRAGPTTVVLVGLENSGRAFLRSEGKIPCDVGFAAKMFDMWRDNVRRTWRVQKMGREVKPRKWRSDQKPDFTVASAKSGQKTVGNGTTVKKAKWSAE